MKFNCGPTWQEKKLAKMEWHPYFAWLPKRVGHRDCRWLETIERRGVYTSVMGSWSWSYRTIEQ